MCVSVVCGCGWVSGCVGVYFVRLWCVCVFSRVPMVPEVPLQPAGGGPTVVGTEIINVSNDDIEEVWRRTMWPLCSRGRVRLRLSPPISFSTGYSL